MCYTASPCWLSILNTAVCTRPSQTRSLSLPSIHLPWRPSVCSLSLWVCFKSSTTVEPSIQKFWGTKWPDILSGGIVICISRTLELCFLKSISAFLLYPAKIMSKGKKDKENRRGEDIYNNSFQTFWGWKVRCLSDNWFSTVEKYDT